MATYRLPVADWVYTSLSDPYNNDRTSPAVSLASGDIGFRSCLFLKFQELPESLWFKHIESMSCIGVYASTTLSDGQYSYASLYAYGLFESADFPSLVYNDLPVIADFWTSRDDLTPESPSKWLSLRISRGAPSTHRAEVLNALRYGMVVEGGRSDSDLSAELMAYTPASSFVPYLEIAYNLDAKSELLDISPQSGYVPKHSPSLFSWRVSILQGQVCYGEMGQSSGAFRWRPSGSSTVYSIDCGTSQQCIVPADTFTSDEIEWQVTVVTSAGETLSSDWYTLSTVEALPEAVPISPVSTMVDGSAPCTFSWTHNIATSTEQTAADLQYHTGDGAWQTLGHVTGDSTECTVPANTFPSGSVYWRVRTYNTDGTAGDWSDPVEIIVVAAPPAPVVQVTSGGAPRVSISWQSTDQQAWEAVVADISSGIVYGLAKGWRLPDYLPDGTYTAKVRVCNKYNLWSPWGSCSVQVSNSAGEPIALTAADGIAVSLRWTSSGYDAYYVLRDGRPIAKTTEQSYTDNFCSGSHTYAVRGVFTATGQYGLSNTVTAASTCDTVYISPVPNAKWLRLRYADTSDRRTSLNTSRTVNYQYLPGAEYPSAEISEWTSATMSVQCAFASPAESAELEALEGSLVCVKDRRGNCAIGVLEALDKQSSRFFDSFSFSIQRVNYVEEVTYD